MVVTPATSWRNTFQNVDQDKYLDRFANILSGSSAAQRLNDACSDPTVAFLLPQPDHSVLILHHLHHDGGTALQPGSGAIWGLCGSDDLASTMIIPSRALDKSKLHVDAPPWDQFHACTNVDEVKCLQAHSSTKYRPHAGLIPVPAFLVRPMMACRSVKPAVLCNAAIRAIVIHGTAAATMDLPPAEVEKGDIEQAVEELGDAMLYVLHSLWHIQSSQDAKQTSYSPGFPVSVSLSEDASVWARALHTRCLGQPMLQTALGAGGGGTITTLAEHLSNVSTTMATVNQQRIDEAARVKATVPKTGFGSLPLIAQRMVLHASARLTTTGAVRQEPLDSYKEMMVFSNASYVRDHLHDTLRSSAHLDIFLPTGFCTAIKTTCLTSALSSRPGMFSLFSCSRQPADNAVMAQDEQDALQMQIKLQDSSNGLSDKDINKLTKSYHVAPACFIELCLLLKNFCGVCLILFGATALITECLQEWVDFLSRDSHHPTLRSATADDPTLPSKVGWYIDKNIQSYLRSCAENTDPSNIAKFHLKFDDLRRCLLDERDYGLRLCTFLHQKLRSHPNPSSNPPSNSHHNNVSKPKPNANPTVVRNPNRFIVPSDQDVWPTFLNHISSCPLKGFCCRYHINGVCDDHCPRSASHNDITDPTQIKALKEWVLKVRTAMKKAKQPRSPTTDDDASPSKKSKPTSTGSSTYPSFSLTPSSTLSAGEKLFLQHPTTTKSPLSLAIRAPSTSSPKVPPGSPTSISGKLHASTGPLSTKGPAPPQVSPDRSATGTPVYEANAPVAVTTPTTSSSQPMTPAKPPIVAPSQSTPPEFALSHTTTKLPPVSPFLPSIPAHVLTDILQSIMHAPQPECQAPLFQFEWTQEAADHNLHILRQHEFSLDDAIKAHPFCGVTIGSEFRPASLLSPLLDSHPLWPAFAERITFGSNYPLAPLDPSDQAHDLAAMLARGNHKSALLHEERLTDMLIDEVVHGWQLILPLKAAPLIPEAVVAPLGIVHQLSINESAETIEKYRLTHDQSFNVCRGSYRSVNNRLRVDDLTPCRFGRAFLRFLHHLAHLRFHHPNQRIFVSKVDCKSAYRRVHLAAATAVQAMVSIGGFLLVALRQTFGGAANPSHWSDISEVATDLANDLVQRDDWDPTVIHSPHQALLVDAHNSDAGADPDAAFGAALPLGVPYPSSTEPKFDCYIDDIFGSMLDTAVGRGGAVIALVLALLGRPVSTSESLPRSDLLSLKKFLAEALPTERKTVLGWLVDARAFIVALPPDKYHTWLRDLRAITKRRGGSKKQLEVLLGRLNHAAYVVPHGRHFVGRLYVALSVATNKRFVTFTDAQLADLRLWAQFLHVAAGGININLLTLRMPTRAFRVDACPQGIGGYSILSGVAWRYPIPEHLIGRVSLNALEFLAAYIGIVMELRLGPPMDSFEVLLSQGDSTSATGWMRRSSFDDADPFMLVLARALASLLHEHQLGHYAQWFAGKLNQVADSLSHSSIFQDLSSPSRRHLLRWELAADVAKSQAVTTTTNKKYASHWRSWMQFLAIVELPHDPFLQQFDAKFQIRLLGCYASAIREHGANIAGRVGKSGPEVQSGTVRAALDSLASAFRAHQLPSPLHDPSGRIHYLLDRQLKGYKNHDPSTKPQKALPPSVLRDVATHTSTPLDVAVGQLAVGAFFFAMRSCEYTKVSGDRRTKLLEVRNIRFFHNKVEMDPSSKVLHLADSVTITFVFQKNDQRDQTVTQHRTADVTLCPVRAWSAIITRIRNHPGCTDTTTVNTYYSGGQLLQVTSVDMLHALRASVSKIGAKTLGFVATDIGTHSIRSAAAMAMYLAGVPVYTIMLIGRWSSDAFLRYIRRQVQEFSSGVSSKMILSPEYFTIPDFVSREDPRVSGNPMNFAARGQVGGVAQSGAARTTMALWG